MVCSATDQEIEPLQSSDEGCSITCQGALRREARELRYVEVTRGWQERSVATNKDAECTILPMAKASVSPDVNEGLATDYAAGLRSAIEAGCPAGSCSA